MNINEESKYYVSMCVVMLVNPKYKYSIIAK